MLDITQSAKTFALSALLLVVPATAAYAQTPYFGVSSNVQTLGMPGGFSNYSNGLSLDNYEYRESDPVGGNWGTAPNILYADGAARGWAQPGELRVKTDATADHGSALAIPNSSPYGFAEVRFWDTATVVSDTLPAGTPVTLVFRNDLDIVSLSGNGNFSGSFYATHTIAGRSSSQQVSFSNRDMDFTVSLGDITVNTKVGARFTLSGRLYLSTHAAYYSSSAGSLLWNGHSEGEMVLKPILISATGEVRLTTDGGATFEVAGN